jgi:hypothetical protein
MHEKTDVGIAVMVGVSLAFLIALGYLFTQVANLRNEMATLHDSIVSDVTKAAEGAIQKAGRRSAAAPVAAAEPTRQMIDSIKQELSDELTSTRRQASALAQHAKAEAVDHANKLAEQDGEERRSQHKEVIGELGQIKQVEASTSVKVNDFEADLANVKNQVATSRQELQQTVSELKRVDGDLGVQSGYIATNARELQALKQLGERNYFDFQIQRSGKPQRVGDVVLSLKKTDPKHNKFTLEVLCGVKRTEKREKTINEPLQFYAAKSKFPSEIVVNEIQKDYIIGYLASPKELVSLSSEFGPVQSGSRP